MSAKLTKEQYIKKCIDKHGNKFLYDDMIYVKIKHDVDVVCKRHGKFKTTANNHIISDFGGCRLCYSEFSVNHFNEIFIKASLISSKEKNIKAKNSFIIKSHTIHNNKYLYEKSIYEKGNKRVCITCPIHGDFLQTPSAHLRGKGCYKCGNLLKGANNINRINKNNNSIDATLYIIKCFNEVEDFYKIGITTKKNLKNRFSSKLEMPYSYEIIHIFNNSLIKIAAMEKFLHYFYKEYQYYPLIKFNGYTECFKI